MHADEYTLVTLLRLGCTDHSGCPFPCCADAFFPSFHETRISGGRDVVAGTSYQMIGCDTVNSWSIVGSATTMTRIWRTCRSRISSNGYRVLLVRSRLLHRTKSWQPSKNRMSEILTPWPALLIDFIRVALVDINSPNDIRVLIEDRQS